MPMSFAAIVKGCKTDVEMKRKIFLAHLSRRLIGELTYAPASLLSLSFNIFKHLILRNRLANQSQILCGASLGNGNLSLNK